MVNRITRILALAALCAAPASLAFAQAYANDGPAPAYPPEVYRAQDVDGGYGPATAYPDRVYSDQAHDAPRDRTPMGPPPMPRGPGDRDYYSQQPYAYPEDQAYRRPPARAPAPARRVEASYRMLTWAGKVEDPGLDRGADVYPPGQGYAGASCPGVQPGERVLNCQYVPFAPPPEPESDTRLANLYIDGGVGPSVIGGGGGGGGGPSNGQVTLGTGFSGVTAPTFSGGGSNGGNGGGSGNGSGNGSGTGSGTGVGTGSGSGIGSATSSSSSSSSASANASANISANITLAGGFFIHGGGGHGGGKSGGCGCGSSGGGGMTGWGGSGSGGMSGWSSGGHKK